MVLVDMAGLEESSVTLKASYLGPITEAPNGGGFLEARLTVLQQDPSISLGAYIALTTANLLYISWSCAPGAEACAGDVRQIRKIF